MSEQETIYVPLLDEGIDVWRPVKARKVSENTYLILDQDYDRDVETWQDEPGAVVRCEIRRHEGRRITVVTELAGKAAAARVRGPS